MDELGDDQKDNKVPKMDPEQRGTAADQRMSTIRRPFTRPLVYWSCYSVFRCLLFSCEAVDVGLYDFTEPEMFMFAYKHLTFYLLYGRVSVLFGGNCNLKTQDQSNYDKVCVFCAHDLYLQTSSC
jgi:hypothetical protein